MNEQWQSQMSSLAKVAELIADDIYLILREIEIIDLERNLISLEVIAITICAVLIYFDVVDLWMACLFLISVSIMFYLYYKSSVKTFVELHDKEWFGYLKGRALYLGDGEGLADNPFNLKRQKRFYSRKQIFVSFEHVSQSFSFETVDPSILWDPIDAYVDTDVTVDTSADPIKFVGLMKLKTDAKRTKSYLKSVLKNKMCFLDECERHYRNHLKIETHIGVFNAFYKNEYKKI